MKNRLVWLVVLFCLAGCGGGFKRFLYSGFGRDGWQQPGRVIVELAIEPGDRIADIGTGGGYFTFKLAQATGPRGVVYAVDIDSAMTAHVESEAEEMGLAQVRTILAQPDDPGLPEGEIDLVFLSNTYHHIEDRAGYFARTRRALAADGQVAIIEFREEGLFHTLFGHATGSEKIRAEMAEAGYRLVREPNFLDRQHFLIFEAGEATGQP